MIVALKLNKRGTYAGESRLDTAMVEVEWYLREYGKPMEGIGRVSCKICGLRSIIRLTIWEQPTPDMAHVYRIPGLLYDNTIPEGIGLVLQDKNIIGQTMYGTPAYGYARLEVVDIGSAKP